jgi:hypothetical protein
MPSGTFLVAASFPLYASEPLRAVWLVIAVVAGMSFLALFDPGSVAVLVTAEL